MQQVKGGISGRLETVPPPRLRVLLASIALSLGLFIPGCGVKFVESDRVRIEKLEETVIGLRERIRTLELANANRVRWWCR